MKYSLTVYNELTGNTIFQSEIYNDTKLNMDYLSRLYDDYDQDTDKVVKFREHGKSNDF